MFYYWLVVVNTLALLGFYILYFSIPFLIHKASSFGLRTAESTLRGCSTRDCYSSNTAMQSRRVLFAPPLLSSENFKDPKTVVLKPKDTFPSENNRHVVYFFLDPQNTKSSYDVNYTMLQAIILHNQKTLASSSSSWQTHVITSNDKIIELLSDNNNNNNNNNKIQIVDYRKLPLSKRVQRFQSIYISQSFNDVEYESFCMWRWIVIAEYFESLAADGIPVANILGLDTDVLLVEDPLIIVQDIDWTVVQSYRVINGAAMMWTLSGLETFVTFLIDLYEDGAKMAMELVKQHGSIHPECYKPGSLLLPCFPTHTDPSNENNNIPQDYSMWHISDMEWYRAWSRQNLSLRLTRPDPHLISCYVISHIDEDHSFRFVRLGTDHVLGSPTNDEQALKRVCFLHFQGETKEAVFPFLSFLEGDSHEYFLPPR